MKAETHASSYPFKSPGLVVRQPFGDFFVAALPVEILLDTAFSDRLRAQRENGSYRLEGSQRNLMEGRLKDIGKFITAVGAVFPNTIILAANYREEDGLIEEREEEKWLFDVSSDAQTGVLTIKSPTKLAPIIDGQHRLFAFNFASERNRLDTRLLCAIYFDLPKPYQAFLFATINSTQRPVSKSQTYELFGYNVEDEPPEQWTPEKLSVFLARKLNTEEDSPFFHRILIAAENDLMPSMAEARKLGQWAVSTATVVEGVVRLISSNPKMDAYTMAGRLEYEGNSRSILMSARPGDKAPLRKLYVEGNDKLILTFVKNYFRAVSSTVWKTASPQSYILKTVGIQALFDIGRRLFNEAVGQRNVSFEFFAKRLDRARRIDFMDTFFQFSGTGRIRIRTVLEFAIDLRSASELEDPSQLIRDSNEYHRLLASK